MRQIKKKEIKHICKKIVFNIVSKILLTGINIFGQRKGVLLAAHLIEQLRPIVRIKTKLGTIQFYCLGKIPLWRANTLLTKEPETIEWIDTFDKNDVFWDIGANIGVYSLYAALRLNTVMAFEPAAINYFLLNRNIEINNMDKKIFSLCMALNDISCLDSFYMSSTEGGRALHSFSESVDFKKIPFTADFSQAMIGFSIDDFIDKFDPPFPTHIKIDVDGIENKIIAGARKTIKNNNLKSLLIELDMERKDHKKVISILEYAGMKLRAKQHTIKSGTGRFSSIRNYIFVRY